MSEVIYGSERDERVIEKFDAILTADLPSIEKLLLLTFYRLAAHIIVPLPKKTSQEVEVDYLDVVSHVARKGVPGAPVFRLAQLAGMHRVTAQRAMQSLRKAGIIKATDYGNVIAWDRLRRRDPCGGDVRNWLKYRDSQVEMFENMEKIAALGKSR
jgi:hypothetical protein